MTDPPDATTGSEYVLSALGREDVSRLFGIVGEGNAHPIDRTIHRWAEYTWARHEAVAVTMADGDARRSGRSRTSTSSTRSSKTTRSSRWSSTPGRFPKSLGPDSRRIGGSVGAGSAYSSPVSIGARTRLPHSVQEPS
ncbi:MAG: hypothetical protein ACI9YT_000050 [Halobacteriales archaeon]|jgi:hypothetical protein